ILEATPNATVTVGTKGEITFVNTLAESVFGWSRRELVGRPVETLIPERLREEHVQHRAEFLAEPIPRPLYLRTGLSARRRDGTEFPVWVGLSTIVTSNGAVVLATV